MERQLQVKRNERSFQTPAGVGTVGSEWDMTHTRMRRPEIMIKDSLDLIGSASSMRMRDTTENPVTIREKASNHSA